MTKPLKSNAKLEIGHGGTNTRYGEIRGDEFLKELKGKRGIKKYREMRDNDATIGSVMYATEQVLRDVPRTIQPADDSAQAQEMAVFLEQVLGDMEHTLDDHISEALSSLTFGFAIFEVVYKRRKGFNTKDPKKKSKFNDGYFGIRKLASRAQWTINEFKIDKKTGEVLGVTQDYSGNDGAMIPSNKILHYKTTNTNNDPSGRSILRNAYKSYTFLNNLQTIEAIAVERELNGIPIGRMPADYLSADATADQVALRQTFEQVLRDLKFNEQGYALLPSDVYIVDDKATDVRQMDIELITSNGTRNIDINPIISRYQHDIARSVMAEFLMLGSSSTGSYALSKSKTDLFLRSMEAYINSIYDVLNKQLVEPLWAINGFDVATMPTIVAGDVAPHDLKELGAYLRNLNGADISLADQLDIVDSLLDTAELPKIDRNVYQQSRERAFAADTARNDYYDDDKTPGGQDSPKTKETSVDDKEDK